MRKPKVLELDRDDTPRTQKGILLRRICPLTVGNRKGTYHSFRYDKRNRT